MKRLPQLEPLSHDHHRGLVLARRIRESLSSSEQRVRELATVILQEYETTLRGHFTLEEQYIAPPLERAGRAELVERLRTDHAKIRTLIGLGQTMAPDDIRAFGVLLEDHIRFEERELFEEAQAILTEAELETLATASKRH